MKESYHDHVHWSGFLHRLVTACHILPTGKQPKQLRNGKSPDGRLK